MQLKVTDPSSVQFTLTMTFELQDWRRLRKELTKHYPAWDIGKKIDDMVQQVEKTFRPAAEDDIDGIAWS